MAVKPCRPFLPFLSVWFFLFFFLSGLCTTACISSYNGDLQTDSRWAGSSQTTPAVIRHLHKKLALAWGAGVSVAFALVALFCRSLQHGGRGVVRACGGC